MVLMPHFYTSVWDEPMTWYPARRFVRVADARQRDDVQDVEFQVLTWKQLILFLASLRPTSLAPVALVLLAGGAFAVAWPLLAARGNQSDVKRRLKVETQMPAVDGRAGEEEECRRRARKGVPRPRTNSTPRAIRKMSRGCGMKLIQAGYMDPGAVGTFFLIRFGGFFVGAVGAFLAQQLDGEREATTFSRWSLVILAGATGYFLPGLLLGAADRDQDARIPQRLSRFHGPDDRLLRRRHEHGGRHRARVEGTGHDLSVAQPESAARVAGVAGPGAASTTR